MSVLHIEVKPPASLLAYASERKRKHASDQMRDRFPIFASDPCYARPGSPPPTRTPTPPAFALDPGSVTLEDDDDVAPADRWKYDLS
ncbi:hypothetical protein BC826DRAFT_1106792 [Russula brevipes]|nr:hypothetical protein BC826DRAFT_1106792 [Russula brevipes]